MTRNTAAIKSNRIALGAWFFRKSNFEFPVQYASVKLIPDTKRIQTLFSQEHLPTHTIQNE